jgi:hypothetical protein
MVKSRFKNAGFTQVKVEKIEDLITGWLKKDGAVKSVAIGGDDEFSQGDKFRKDIDVVIRYHTFMSDQKVGGEDGSSNSPKPSPSDADKSAASQIPEVNKDETPKTESNNRSSSDDGDILTPTNNADMAAALGESNPGSPIIRSFAEKYKDRMVDFDGAVEAWMLHGKYKTRADILINAGDYDADSSHGPDFRIVSIGPEGIKDRHGDSHLPGLFPVGSNVHVRGRIEKYEPDPACIFLDGVTLSERG